MDGSDEVCPSTACYDKTCSQFDGEDILRDEYIMHLQSKINPSPADKNKNICNISEITHCDDHSQQCYLRDKVCVYERLHNQTIASCQSGAHLQDCYDFDCPGMFFCYKDKAYCIPYSHVCDGIVDCPSGEDENSCENKKGCPGMLKCKHDNICVHPRDQGDGVMHCPLSGDDESLCKDYMCPHRCKCIGRVYICSNINIAEPPQVSKSVNALFLSHNLISANNLTNFQCKYLHFIDLSHNMIERVRFLGAKESCKYLIRLDISHNNINEIRFNKYGILPILGKLDLSYNPVRYIEEDSFLACPYSILLMSALVPSLQ